MAKGEPSTTVAVRYPDGRVAMGAFWGYLSRGGLVLFDHRELAEGERVAINVHIDEHGVDAEVSGVVVRSTPAGPTVVAFAEGESSGSFLRAALAGRPVDRACSVTDHGGAADPRPARLIDLGEPGCTVALDSDDAFAFQVGSRVELALAGGTARGDVVWARGRERGILFDDDGELRAVVTRTLG